jgi:acyl-CoA synthetase (AMP-forming)/AMP-acid ligase II
MDAGTVRCAANHAPLTPISFIQRAAAVYGDRAAVVCGERRYTWREARGRCVRLAAALAARGDVVSGTPMLLALLAYRVREHLLLRCFFF